MMNLAAKMADKSLGPVPTSTPSQPVWDETVKMHAVSWHGKKDVRYEEKPRPHIADPRDVVIRVTATTVCGSDLHLYSGSMPDMHTGDILGHESMGVVEEIGSEVKTLQIGQRVVVAFDIACGLCEYCKRQQYTTCDTTNPSKLMEKMYGHRTAALFGYSHLTGGIPGEQAEFVRVPFADINCLPIPDDVPDEKALYLSDIVPTAYHGTELANVQPGTVVGVWGLGPVGLCIARWCQIRGASRIIGIDCVPERLQIAKRLGIETVDFKAQNTVQALQEMVPGGLDCAIEAVGFEWSKTLTSKIERAIGLETDTADILSECITCTRKNGIISIIGAYAGYANHFPIGAFMEKHQLMTGGQSPTQKYWKMALEKIRTGEFDPTFVVSHKLPLSEAPLVYHKFFNREDGVVKVFLRPDYLMKPQPTQ